MIMNVKSVSITQNQIHLFPELSKMKTTFTKKNKALSLLN